MFWWWFWWCIFRWCCVGVNLWQKSIFALFLILKWIIIFLSLELCWLVHWYSPSLFIFTSRKSILRILVTTLKIARTDSFWDRKSFICFHEIIKLILNKHKRFRVLIDWIRAHRKFDAIGRSDMIHLLWILTLSFCIV